MKSFQQLAKQAALGAHRLHAGRIVDVRHGRNQAMRISLPVETLGMAKLIRR